MFTTELDAPKLAADAAAELAENINFFCNTPKGSLPQMRDYGLDYENIIDRPPQQAKIRATVDIITGLRDYFDIGSDSGTFVINTITVTPQEDGRMKIYLKIGGKQK